ncbi:MAG: CbiX/SirB N-terminal domain-containing protein [Gemmatimonadota bacterium]
MRTTSLALIGPALLAASAGALAQAPVIASAPIGTIVVAHGGDSLWNSLVLDAAKSARTGGPVEVAFLMGPGAKAAPFQSLVAKLERQGVSAIAIVPLLVSSHSGHFDQVRYLAGDSVKLDESMQHHLHMAGHDRARAAVPIRVAPALDQSPALADVLTDRALAMTPNPRERAVLIVGHGPNSAEDYAAWMAHLRVVADSVRRRGGFRDVRVELVRDDAPAPVRAEAVLRTRELVELQSLATGKKVLVVPLLISRGAISRDKLPSDLQGTPSEYSGEPLLPHPAIVRWIEQSALTARSVPSAAAR